MQLIELLRCMGVEVEQLAEDAYAFCARDIDFEYLKSDDYRQRCTRLRGSVMLIGPMLARFGEDTSPSRAATRSADAGSTPISSDSRNSARSSTSTSPTSSSWSKAGS